MAQVSRFSTKLSRARFLLAIISSLVVGIAIWWPVSIPLQGFLPSPLDVAEAFGAALGDPALYEAMGATLRRVVIGWVQSRSAPGSASGWDEARWSTRLPSPGS